MYVYCAFVVILVSHVESVCVCVCVVCLGLVMLQYQIFRYKWAEEFMVTTISLKIKKNTPSHTKLHLFHRNFIHFNFVNSLLR